jgi:hypothetical protein
VPAMVGTHKRKVAAGVKLASESLASGLGSKATAHVEDVEVKLLLGFDGDGTTWTAAATVNSASGESGSKSELM